MSGRVVDRRRFLAGTTAAIIAGFNPVRRGWVTAAEAAEVEAFDDVPPLDGMLLRDDTSRDAASTDNGNLVVRRPGAVLVPGSVRDISEMIRFCRRHQIAVATRGQAHSTHGQGLSDGLLIESPVLGPITFDGDTAWVDAGRTWKELVVAAYERSPRLTPPALTGYVGLSVGGTLSMGGVGGLVGSTHTGLQVDHVRELEVVTGTGDVVRCSETESDELFDAMLGGLGQCGVITRARIELVPARERARTFNYHHVDNAAFFADLRALLRSADDVDHVYTVWMPPGQESAYQLQATCFYDTADLPGPVPPVLSVPPVVQDATYLDYVQQIDQVIDGLRAVGQWDSLVKPWFDVWLPEATVEQYVGRILAEMTPLDVGPTGFVLLFAQRRSALSRPFARVAPGAADDEWVFLFDVLTASAVPGQDAYAAPMVQRNRRWFDLARDEYGGVRYPIGSLDFDAEDWKDHFAEQWPAFRERKHRYDPNGIMTPGPGIFG